MYDEFWQWFRGALAVEPDAKGFIVPLEIRTLPCRCPRLGTMTVEVSRQGNRWIHTNNGCWIDFPAGESGAGLLRKEVIPMCWLWLGDEEWP